MNVSSPEMDYLLMELKFTDRIRELFCKGSILNNILKSGDCYMIF